MMDMDTVQFWQSEESMVVHLQEITHQTGLPFVTQTL